MYIHAMNILVKQVDLFKSVTTPKKYLAMYLVYLMYENTPVSAHIEYGEEAKNNRIKKLNSKYQIKNNITNQYLIN